MDRLKTVAASHLGVKKSLITIVDQQVCIDGLPTSMDWCSLVEMAFLERVCLTENGHYATPKIHFDKLKEKGHPFAYHVFGLALTEVTLDCLRGSYVIDAVKTIHDFGQSMNMDIDLGQIEGGLVQGIGWMTMEDLQYDKQGRLMSNALSTYKIPDIYSVPKDISVIPLQTEGTNMAIKKSKAVGEPPLMYGIGTYFALQKAISSFNDKLSYFSMAPYTHEKILMDLYANRAIKTSIV